MKTAKDKKISRFWLVMAVVCMMAAVFAVNGNLYAEEPEPSGFEPSYATAKGLPNVLFILDNSDSMQDSPYLDGRKTPAKAARPNMMWSRGYVTDPVTKLITAENNLVYFGASDVEIDIPGRLITEITGDITKTYGVDLTADPPVTTSFGVYDEAKNKKTWETYKENFVTDYKYRLIRITDKDTGEVQEKTIDGIDTGYKRWHVSDDLKYDPTTGVDYSGYVQADKNFSYVIVAGSPGEVTRVRCNPNDPDVSPLCTKTDSFKLVYDGNADWDKIEAGFDSTFKYKTLEITGGTNDGEKRIISTYNKDNKCWVVSLPFPNICDFTTRYRILETEEYDSTAYAFGGNHPASKLYQAKEALLAVLTDDQLKDDKGRYKLNMGFATYMSARMPRVTGRYYKADGSNTTEIVYQGVYKSEGSQNFSVHYDNPGNEHPPTTFDSGSNAISEAEDGPFSKKKLFYNAVLGDIFYKEYTDSVTDENGDKKSCNPETLLYRLVEIDSAPGPDTPNRYKFSFASSHTAKDYTSNFKGGSTAVYKYPGDGGFTNYAWRSPETVTSCDNLPGLPDSYTSDGTEWTKVSDTDPCYAPDECYEKTKSDYYSIQDITTFGDYGITDSSSPGYIDKDTNKVRPVLETPNDKKDSLYDILNTKSYRGYKIIPDVWMITDGIVSESSVTNDPLLELQCKSEDTWISCSMTDDGEKRIILKNVSISSNSTDTTDVVGNVVDTTYFSYPGEGTDDRPHGWSYKRTCSDWVYKRTSDNFPDATLRSTWTESAQTAPENFPADSEHDSTDDAKDDFANHRGDDQVLFVNLPEYDPPPSAPNPLPDNYVAPEWFYGDDIGGTNIDRIITMLGSANGTVPRAKSPCVKGTCGTKGSVDIRIKGISGAKQYYYSMAPYTDSLAMNSMAYEGMGTPLAASLRDAARYFKSYKEQDELTQNGCRNNFVILLTDGLETADDDPDNAPKTAVGELRDLFSEDNGVRTFVIGFGLDTDSQAKLEALADEGVYSDAKDDEDTKAYFATDKDELVRILIEEILHKITGAGSFTQAAPTVTRLLEEGDDLRMYYSYYDYPLWRGHLMAYAMDKNTGLVSEPLQDWDKDCPRDDKTNIASVDLDDDDITDTDADSDAGCQMKHQFSDNALNRNVKTYDGSSIIQFKDISTVDLKIDNVDIDGDGQNGTNNDAQTVINYVMDPGYTDSNGNSYAGSRDPDWFLGDTFMSSPVVVTPPKFSSSREGYDSFKSDASDRATTIYLSSNDGMLHAISELDGTEKWAYIPQNALYRLYVLKNAHIYTTDGPVTVGDLDLRDDSNNPKVNWTTVLAGGMGRGEKYYYFLDVTDPENPTVIFEISDIDATPNDSSEEGGVMGYTWSPAAFGHININGKNRAVAFVGGGHSKVSGLTYPSDSMGNRIYIIDIQDNSIKKEFEVLPDTNNVPSQLLTVRYSELNGMPMDYTATPRTALAEPDTYRGNIEVVYFGDTNGSLWRLGPDEDGSGGLNSIPDGNSYTEWASNVHLVKLYDPDEDKPIYHKPTVVDYPSSGCRFILFGTGNELNHNDSSQQYFAEVEDRSLTDEEKIAASSDETANNKVRLSWRTGDNGVSPIGAGEHVLSSPSNYKGTVYFTTYKAAPVESSADDCSTKLGDGYLYGYSVSTCGTTGGEDALTVTVTDDDGNTTTIPSNKNDLGQGFPTSPTIASPQGHIIKTTEDGTPTRIPFDVQTNPAKILMWREVD
ncbi:MAG: VWA domain-containing protein [Desulfobacteraceae bacterium]|nr:VWA domain-containing protein [Desulfobacteraceae bacterium]